MARIGLATLMTDFGTHDPYVGAMKGVILSTCPMGRIVDLSHDVPPHNILAGAFTWAEAAAYFPPGTVHVGVVDPGVGTQRKILAAVMNGQTFLFPDNGLITFLAQKMAMEALVVVNHTKFLPSPGTTGATFDGRDIFAPIAGQLMNGMKISDLGPQPQTYKTLDISVPVQNAGELVGQVIYVDRFGNLISNVSRKQAVDLADNAAKPSAACAGRDIGPLVKTYADAPADQPLALFNSMDLLEIAVNTGRACDVLSAGIGAEIRLTLQ